MKRYSFDTQPKIRYLSDDEIVRVHEGALRILEGTGVLFEGAEALSILADAGCDVDRDTRIVRIPADRAEDAIRKIPGSFELWNRPGTESLTVGGENYYFDPGSSGLNFLESDGKTVRPAVTDDMVRLYRLADALPHLKLQSTALSVSDVPEDIVDCYRVWLLLKNTTKPFVSGAYEAIGARRITDILSAVRGSEEALREKPLAVMDICSQPPLKWGETSCSNIIDFARFGIPIETISVPMPGTASPATLAGSLVIHLAESISGMALAQAAGPGTPMVMGGAPMTFDMRYSTTSLNAVETSIISTAYAQIARYYGIPSHNYACLADPKVVDAQAGLESGVSAVMATLGGVNIISGPGMIDFVNTFSLEKLVIDHEIIAMADRLYRGMEVNDETLALDLIEEMGSSGDYLKTKHTRKFYRSETYVPSVVIDKMNRARWTSEGETDVFERARAFVDKTLESHVPEPLPPDTEAALDAIMADIRASSENG
ncbi:MAG: trimethylamine methyltransferase family protein [Clostridiales Family XIII bacterium]|nr:trimethylamine methyltransferase family protein [Clostridiales Family XIII bacterium]